MPYLCICIHCSFVTYGLDKREAEVHMHRHLFTHHGVFCGDFQRRDPWMDNDRCWGGWRKHYVILEIPQEVYRMIRDNREFRVRFFRSIHRAYRR